MITGPVYPEVIQNSYIHEPGHFIPSIGRYIIMNTCFNHPDIGTERQCRTCGRYCCHECIHESSGICKDCLYKGAVILTVIMVIISYTAWFGLF